MTTPTLDDTLEFVFDEPTDEFVEIDYNNVNIGIELGEPLEFNFE